MTERCGHWYWADTLGPTFGVEMRDGVAYPVMDDPGPAVAIDDDTVIAEVRYYVRASCPVCAGEASPHD